MSCSSRWSNIKKCEESLWKLWTRFTTSAEIEIRIEEHQLQGEQSPAMDHQVRDRLNIRGLSIFPPKFWIYFQRWFAKKLHMILRNGFPYFISTLLDLKKNTSKQLFFQNRDLGASLTAPPQRRFLKEKKRKNVFNCYHGG